MLQLQPGYLRALHDMKILIIARNMSVNLCSVRLFKGVFCLIIKEVKTETLKVIEAHHPSSVRQGSHYEMFSKVEMTEERCR